MLLCSTHLATLVPPLVRQQTPSKIVRELCGSLSSSVSAENNHFPLHYYEVFVVVLERPRVSAHLLVEILRSHCVSDPCAPAPPPSPPFSDGRSL